MRVILAVALGIATSTALSSALAQPQCPMPPALPVGSYGGPCESCNCINGILCCFGCKMAQVYLGLYVKKPTPSCINLWSCASQYIVNDHGDLKCGRSRR
jgi:hypothetical protein